MTEASQAPSSPGEAVPRRDLALVVVWLASLVVMHGVFASWGAQFGWADSAWDAWVEHRSDRFRVLCGGQYLPLVAEGGWWRLWTSGWVHGDVLHLVVNLIALGTLAWILLPILGAARWLGVYSVGVWAGSVVSHLSSIPQSDGASAAAFALLGAGVHEGLTRTDLSDRSRDLLARGFSILTFANVVLSFVVPSLDVAAHVGGLAGGVVAVWGLRTRPRLGLVTAAISVAIGIAGWGGFLGH